MGKETINRFPLIRGALLLPGLPLAALGLLHVCAKKFAGHYLQLYRIEYNNI